MGNVNLLSSAPNKVLRNNVTTQWWGGSGSKQKLKFLGVSTSAALGVVGIKAWKDTAFVSTFQDSVNKTLRPFSRHFYPEALPLTRKKCRESGFPFFSTIRSFSLLTPVACEDVICDCTATKQPLTDASGQIVGTKLVQNCDCKECVSGRVPDKITVNTSSCPPAHTPPPPTKEEKKSSGYCSSPVKVKRECKGGTPTNVSNKPCRAGSNACSQVSDIDIDALSKELGGLKQIDFVVDSDLSHCFLIKQASQITVDSVTRILTEYATAYEDYHAEYRHVLDMMMDTLEDSRKACGAELEVIECKLVLMKAKIDEMKRRIADMDMFMGSLEKLGNASAETAFMANAEYASVAMSERLHSVVLEVKRIRAETKEKERDMLELQALIIVESGRSLK